MLAAAAVLVSACATVPEPAPVADPQRVWQDRQARLSRLAHWMAAGRIAIRAEDDGATLSLHWEQLGDAYQIRLNAPLGGGAVEIAGDPDRVVLRSSEGEGPWTASSPEALLRQRLGWSVPLEGLRYWILGAAEPGVSVENLVLDADGRPERLSQLGWEVHYANYRPFGAYELPTRVFLNNARVSARIVVHRWNVQA
ncbi:MAG: outer membrane lipoprotein LolB [Gammaproteobacteria bacterium]|nr:outer membrane lipoprotein LolB [Gammaproteobacteria bacterium]NIR84626.1 outer membrane lipoprotein LolB [Gammaproteobacteria bacterium]NIR90529.1 outer membrane lipoprotein LolB [Gammaproteobacteria bacterium]NIU05677.1 outer membrane lipoprotein LolB [Gammaproteobacteria bacterium]NIV52816.1 outer membrane lipoprotein LolB [Gammaproteobacteria bacterium]